MNSPENNTEFDPFEHEPTAKKKDGSSGGVAWLALLVAVAAIAFNGWQWWKGQTSDPEQLRQQVAIDDLRRSQQEVGQSAFKSPVFPNCP